MSHLLDSALARQDVRLDITDVYLFRGQVGTVFVMAVNNSAASADVFEGFHPSAHYDFNIDLNGDAVEDLTYRVTFGPLDHARRQPLELHRLLGADARGHTTTGTLLAWGSTETVLIGSGGLRLWAGLATETFYVEPTVLEAMRRAVRNGRKVDLSTWQPYSAVNAFADTSVYAIALEVPDSALCELVDSERQIGFWGATTLGTDAGGWRPINRMGQPMVQSIFNPPEDDLASDYNTTQPVDDWANYGGLFADLVARVVAAHGTAEDPAAYGETVSRMLLPDILSYRLGSAANFSFAGRNGRGLTDNAPEVMFSLVTNCALSDGLTKHHAAGAPTPQFPYVARPQTATR
jgi:hypothetical protein